MCLILFALEQHPDFPLLLAANRDEFHQRPARALHYWADAPDLLAGRDLQAGGTWLGLHRSGRFAAVTNRRSGSATPSGELSRGALCTDWLTGVLPAQDFAAALDTPRYAPFNLLYGWLSGPLYYYCSTRRHWHALSAGVYGLSNGELDSDWPKVRDGRSQLARAIAAGADLEDLFAVLACRRRPGDPELPDTGVGLAIERVLSPRFIIGQDYGTRASTVLRVDQAGRADITERNFSASGRMLGEIRESLFLPHGPA